MAKHKITYALSATALMFGAGIIAPLGAFANVGTDAAPCGSESYQETDKTCSASSLESFKAGLNDSSVESIVLNNTFNVAEDLTIDTTGKTITMLPAKDVFNVTNGATLTIKGNGKIVSGRYIAYADNASFILDGATLEATSTRAYGVYALNGGSATINSGSITSDWAAFAGNNTTGDMNFYVNGGELTSLRYPAIYMPGQVFLNMTGGTLNGGIVARLGQITIDGGTINGQVKAAEVDDGLAKNYSGMPSMSEAIALIGGSYKSENNEYGNNMSLTINDGTVNGEVAVYDLGREAEIYHQNIDVKVTGGTIQKFTTKFTEEEIGFNLNKGYTAGLNNEAGRINIEVSGGKFAAEPAAEDIKEGEEVVKEDDGTYSVLPKEVNLAEQEFVEIAENSIDGYVAFNEKIVADRLAEVKITSEEIDELVLDETAGGELEMAFDISLVDRTGTTIEVKDNAINVSVALTKEQYDALKEYAAVKVVYFDEDGKEAERLAAKIYEDEDASGAAYYLYFQTTHFSTYGVVGVNEAAEAAETADATTPDTGALTNTESASSVNYGGLIATVLVMTVVMVAVELKKHYGKR